VRGNDGRWEMVTQDLRTFDSMMTQVADPRAAPEMLAVREQMRSWRFYDHLRTDAAAPARAGNVGTRTMVLSSDGADLAAALQTIREVGDDQALSAAVDHAFPGSAIEIDSLGGRFELSMRQHGLLRSLRSAELSDGTVRYLLWIAALLSPRPPELLVLNEPETSLHHELLAPLSQLIADAAMRCQIIVVSHSSVLIEAIRDRIAELGSDANVVELVKEAGQTRVAGQEVLDEPFWGWPTR
jgi:predicted ATPase